MLAQIESRLATLARLGPRLWCPPHTRHPAPGRRRIIPRPDQRTTCDLRVCGRADNVLSQIILDNTSAAEQIPKDARGRFITGDGTVFQGYLFDEGQL